MATTAQFIVCEKSGDWAATLRWHQGARPLPLRETRNLIDARAVLFEAPTSILALETTAANAEGVLRLMLEAHRVWPESRVIVMLTSEVGKFANLFWESGAAFVVLSPRRLDRVVRLVERNLARHEPPELTTREWVWARLPWNAKSS